MAVDAFAQAESSPSRLGDRGVTVMGILNVTPDSFSDGGQFQQTQSAIERAVLMSQQGASIIDVGGESTRPRSKGISVDEELDRVIPVIEGIRKRIDTLISIDTSKPIVMQEAVSAGAGFINDVRALREPEALCTAAQLGVPICLVHMKGEPHTMQDNPTYGNVVNDVRAFLKSRAGVCEKAGIAATDIYLDPGFGFGKALEHNMELLRNLGRLIELGWPVLIGLSRKQMVGALLGDLKRDRTAGSVALAMLAAVKGVSILRVHDVAETIDAIRVLGKVGAVELAF